MQVYKKLSLKINRDATQEWPKCKTKLKVKPSRKCKSQQKKTFLVEVEGCKQLIILCGRKLKAADFYAILLFLSFSGKLYDPKEMG